VNNFLPFYPDDWNVSYLSAYYRPKSDTSRQLTIPVWACQYCQRISKIQFRFPHPSRVDTRPTQRHLYICWKSLDRKFSYSFPSTIILLNIETGIIVVCVNFNASPKSASPVIN